jgi:ketosteroid isomerase-like protein
MRPFYASLLLAAASSSVAVAAHAAIKPQPTTCAASGPKSPGELHRQWILVGWEKHRGDPPFDFRKRLGHLYHPDSSDVRLYDNFDPQHRVARSADEWAAIWTEPFSVLREARHSVLDGPDVIDGGSLSASTLEFAARLETAEGEVVGNRARSSLVWQCTSDGWKIVREHTSVRLVPREEIDAIVPGSNN